jgi:hypothetical protein
MSKVNKNYGWLNTRPNSAKTLMERAKREIPGFLKRTHQEVRRADQHLKAMPPALCLATPGASPKSVCTAGNHHLT